QLKGSFRIPKRKSSSDSPSVVMQSPLSQTSGSGYKKIHWSQISNSGRRSQALISLNRHNSPNAADREMRAWSGTCTIKRKSQPSEQCLDCFGVEEYNHAQSKDARLVLTDVLRTELGRDYLNREKGNKESDSRARPTASREISEQNPLALTPHRLNCHLRSGWPKRTSDSLLPQLSENLSKSRLSVSLRRTQVESKDLLPSCRVTGRLIENNNRIKNEAQDPADAKKSLSESNRKRKTGVETEEPQGENRSDSLVPRGGNETADSIENCQTPGRRAVLEQTRQVSSTAKKLCLRWSGSSVTPESPTGQKTDPVQSNSTENSTQAGEKPPCSDQPEQRTEERKMSVRTRHSASTLKPPPAPSEPIVLSSDEEEGNSCTPESTTSLTPATKQLRTSNSEMEEKERQKDIRESENQKLDEDVSLGEKSAESDEKERGLYVELKFSEFHCGKIKGEPHGCLQVTGESIIIPLKDPDNRGETLSLTVVMSELKRYGVWQCSPVGDGSEACTLIFLWVSEAQAQLIQKELSPVYPVEQAAKASEFVLLKLCAKEDEQHCKRLGKLMGQRNGSSELLDPLSQSEGLSLLRRFERNSPLLSVLKQCAAQRAEPEDHRPQSGHTHHSPTSPQEGASLHKPCYTLCHNRVNDSYSVSVAAKPDKCWSQHSYRGPPTRLILYPPPPSKGGIAVTSEDLECLDNGEFLNDVIIDFYLKYLMLEKAPKEVTGRAHIFSSFFYKQLTRKDTPNEEMANISAQHRRHHRVKTWTRHIDIFTKDFLFVPVNQKAHWYLAVICFPWLEELRHEEWKGQAAHMTGVNRTCQARTGPHTSGAHRINGFSNTASVEGSKDCEEEKGKTEISKRGLSASCLQNLHRLPECTQKTCQRDKVCRRPCILIMDSLKLSSHDRTVKLLQEYLQVEWEVRRGTPREFTSQVEGCHCSVPLQNNSSDCGIYLLQYVESFLQDPVVHFDFPLLLEQWFPRQEVNRKRDEIRDLVLQLYSQQKNGSQ
ncbi:SENP7 protease, partial [Atractosteus spatula]|nr:SENP7 protease [Atractosteus spatula]